MCTDCAAAIEPYPLQEQNEDGIQQHAINFKDVPTCSHFMMPGLNGTHQLPRRNYANRDCLTGVGYTFICLSCWCNARAMFTIYQYNIKSTAV